jgi:hypothetical protein
MLNAPLDAETADWISRSWDEVEGALRSAYHDGMEAARPLIDGVAAKTKELVESASKRAEVVRAALNERLNTYLQTLIDEALKRVRPTVSVGGRELAMVSVTLEQEINLSGSLKASLTEVCEFIAEGKMSLSAEYAASKPA